MSVETIDFIGSKLRNLIDEVDRKYGDEIDVDMAREAIDFFLSSLENCNYHGIMSGWDMASHEVRKLIEKTEIIDGKLSRNLNVALATLSDIASASLVSLCKCPIGEE